MSAATDGETYGHHHKFAEMALAGIAYVGEFHYLYHHADGTPYDNPNAMGEALRQAAVDAGIRLTLLDTCYLTGGLAGDGPVPLNQSVSLAS